MKSLNLYPVILGFLILFSCKSKNYIKYYRNVYAADSIMRFKHDTITSLAKYDRIFRRYQPKNDERLNEFARYILISEKYHRNFGGKKSLLKLIQLNAVPWTSATPPKNFVELNKKYGIDEDIFKNEVARWKNGLNNTLIDSFKIAFKRDQDGRPHNLPLVKKNVNKNARFLKWTFEHYGFPTADKIGWFPRPTFISHMIESDLYPYFQQKIFQYVKSGDCNPRDYGMLMDYGIVLTEKQDKTAYGRNGREITDSLQVNRNRGKIGLPSLKQGAKINQEFFAKKQNSGT